jgi:uncharacterized protein
MPDIRFALLFGSAASAKQRPDSDIDIALYVDARLTARERFDVRLKAIELLADLGDPDITILNDAPALLAHRALQGKLLFTVDRVDFVRFFVKTMAASEDERHFREIHDKARLRRISEARFG